MASIAERYCDELLHNLAYSGTWLPSNRLALGDIALVKGGVLERQRSIKSLGVRFSTTEASAPEDLVYASKGGVTLAVKGRGHTLDTCPNVPKTKLGMSITFDQHGGIVFTAAGCNQRQIEDRVALAEDIRRLYSEGKWDLDWLVITELVAAERATILVSSQGGASAEISLDAKGQLATADLASLNLSSSLVFSKNLDVKIFAKERLTPLYRASRLRKRIISRRVEFSGAYGRRRLPLKPARAAAAQGRRRTITIERLSFEPVARYATHARRNASG